MARSGQGRESKPASERGRGEGGKPWSSPRSSAAFHQPPTSRWSTCAGGERSRGDLGWPRAPAGLILPCKAPYLRHGCQQQARGRGEKLLPVEQGAALPSKHCTQSPRGRPGKQRPGAGRVVVMARVSGRLLPPARRESQPGSASPTSRPRLGTSRRGSGAGRRGQLLPAQLEPPKSEPLLSAAFYRAIKPQVHVQTLAGISLGHLQHRFSTSCMSSISRASFPRAQPPAAPKTDKRTWKEGHGATPAPAK